MPFIFFFLSSKCQCSRIAVPPFHPWTLKRNWREPRGTGKILPDSTHCYCVCMCVSVCGGIKITTKSSKNSALLGFGPPLESLSCSRAWRRLDVCVQTISVLFCTGGGGSLTQIDTSAVDSHTHLHINDKWECASGCKGTTGLRYKCCTRPKTAFLCSLYDKCSFLGKGIYE